MLKNSISQLRFRDLIYTAEDCASMRYDVAKGWLTFWTDVWFNFEHGHFTPYCSISLQQAESLTKCPIMLKFAHLTEIYSLVYMLLSTLLAILWGRRMSSSLPVVMLRVEHTRNWISRDLYWVTGSSFVSRYAFYSVLQWRLGLR